ncbi:putative manganese efflux pump MntP [Methanobrevibacter cuticularis]|uniref:Putative manganese efflux pump MntP n=1 Tax=Methanobrevibacter cuticularis TaxID=47311 RepID=A0A166D8B5_9EURY|nr:manganese efflux pump MntP family protein [Methanobrevibacter cuticularis]KZX15310.1 putative manganese efflux pump MntP [Methanobrevibacter cuticularis]
MDIYSIFLIAIALAMDAFSVSLTKGFIIKNIRIYQIIVIGLFFGGFQVGMPVLGWIAGEQIREIVSSIAPYIAFILLLIIGLKMIYDSAIDEEEKEESSKSSFSYKELTLLAIATSIDAFAVGITFSFLNIPILIPVTIIGITTFLLSETGIFIGKKLGHLFGNKFEIIGGVILILLGLNILLQGLGFY